MNELTCYFLASAAYVNGAQILLNNNKLTGVDQSAFQAILDYFKKNGINATIALGNSTRPPVFNCLLLRHNGNKTEFIIADPINCETTGGTCYSSFGWITNTEGSNSTNFFKNGTCADGKSVNELPSSCNVPIISTTPSPSSTARPKKKKKPLAAFAITWVNSVLASIFQKGK